MRLLSTDNFEVKEFGDDEVPRYAILSHTWDEEEVTFQDMEGTRVANKKGHEKVKSCCSVARASGLKYVWIDTCCIDKTSSAELSEAINSMYRWYQEADVCYGYLADVPSKAVFSSSRWFTRGWTLQELIAPSTVIFLDEEWKELGTKANLRHYVSACAGIPVSILSGDDDLETFSIAQRMSWAAKRKTSRIEDRAYCLLGIFGINMPLIYGERETAFTRLQEEIMRISDDHSLFAWKSSDNRGGLLATSPAAFIGSNNIVQFNSFNTFNNPLTVSSRGIHLEIRLIGIGPRGLGLAILHCKERDGGDKPIAIYVKDLFLTMDRFERVWSEEFKQLDLRKFRPSQYAMRRICIRKGHMTRMQKPKDLEKCNSISPEKVYSNDTLMNLLNLGERTALLRAAETGLEDIVWLLLTRSDVEANLGDEIGLMALSHAVKGGHEAVVKILLSRSNVNANRGDNYGQTPLSWAARNGHKAVVKLLLGTDKVDVDSKDRIRRTPLSCRTPLWWAAGDGREAVVKLLLETDKVDVDLMDDGYSQTPLSLAAKNGHEAIVKLLLGAGKVNIKSKDNTRRTPLSWAAGNGHEAVVKLLLGTDNVDIDLKDDSYGRTPLSWAAENGHEAVVKLLLETDGVGVNSKDNNRRTPLSWAAGNGHEAVVKLLLGTGGVVVDSKDKGYGRTPLSWAAKNGHEAVVKLLLETGKVDVKSKDRDGRKPLSWAAGNGHEDVVKLLLETGKVDIESRDKGGRTALSWAAKNRNDAVVKLLKWSI
ncbi:MAG: hypothetical protein M1839_002423 [Geoglossum umbratile]|nr:MAG: hypothetical protein M1839_002423 [Geoglossum umbratile]